MEAQYKNIRPANGTKGIKIPNDNPPAHKSSVVTNHLKENESDYESPFHMMRWEQ